MFFNRYSATATFAVEPSHGLIAKLIVVPELSGTEEPPDELLETSLHATATSANETRAHAKSAPLRDLIAPPFLPGSLPGSHHLEFLRWRGEPETYRAAIVLRYVEGLPLDEVAAILKQPLGTAKSNVHRAVNLLRRAITDSRRAERSRP